MYCCRRPPLDDRAQRSQAIQASASSGAQTFNAMVSDPRTTACLYLNMSFEKVQRVRVWAHFPD